MSPTLTTELSQPSPQNSEAAAVTVEVCEDDVMRLQVLATAAGVGGPNAPSFSELLSSTLHRGIIESYKTVELAGLGDPAGTGSGSGDRNDKCGRR